MIAAALLKIRYSFSIISQGEQFVFSPGILFIGNDSNA